MPPESLTPGAAPAPRWLALVGLRAVAMLIVVGSHADGMIGHGAVAVDVFFTLSGFLITSLLVAEWDATGRVDLGRFYRKRLRRLTPVLLTMCATVALLAVVAASRPRQVLEGALASVLYVANLWLYSGHATPLLYHTWTLGLETQFYLLWPLLIIVVLKSRLLGPVLLLVCVALSVTADVVGFGPVAYTYARAVGLPIGCALAMVLRKDADGSGGRRLATAGPSALLALLALSLVPENSLPILNGALAALPSLLTVPALVCLTRTGFLTSQLQRPRLIWLGQRSYSLYLWHFPILSVAINQLPSDLPIALRLTAAVTLSLFVSALSYRYIELPLLRRRPSLRPVIPAGG